MSTRCNIIIKEKDEQPLIIYHHFDGYPEGVGAELKSVIADKIESICGCTGNKTFILSRILYDFSTQYEETDNIHGDIEYLYVLDIKDDGVLYKCYEVPIFTDYDIETLENCELVETMFINYKKHQEPDQYNYPTLQEGIAYVSTKDWKNMRLDELLTLFHDYMNTPI